MPTDRKGRDLDEDFSIPRVRLNLESPPRTATIDAVSNYVLTLMFFGALTYASTIFISRLGQSIPGVPNFATPVSFKTIMVTHRKKATPAILSDGTSCNVFTLCAIR